MILDTVSQIANSWGQHGAHLGPVGPRWAPCWPHEPCYQGLAFLLSFIEWPPWQVSVQAADGRLCGENVENNKYRQPHSRLRSGAWFNIKMSSYQYRKSHCGDKTVVRSSYLHNEISYTGKMAPLYWIRALYYNVIRNGRDNDWILLFRWEHRQNVFRY